MRKGKKIKLTAEQTKELDKLVKLPKSEQRMVLRGKIILMLASGISQKNVAEELDISKRTVRKWRNRFKEKGIEGLKDAIRSGRPSEFTVLQRSEVIAIACDSPKNYGHETHNHWTLDILTETVNTEIEGLNMSRSSVERTLKENELRPHKFKPWLHSKDPAFREKTNEIITLYTEPPEEAVVICVDEKTSMQATERKHETKLPGCSETGKYEHEYIRHGTQTLIAGFNIKTGHVLAECDKTRKGDDLVNFMEGLALEYKDEKEIHIVWDNLNIHYDGAVERWTKFNERHDGKFVFHYTPIHASWINQVEIFFSILQRRVLKFGSFKSEQDLREQILNFIKKWNKDEGHPFNWTFRGYPMQRERKEAA